MTRRPTGGAALRWLAGLLALYLGAPLVALAVRFASSPHRGFHRAGLFPALWLSVGAATISLVLITLVGLPLAFVLAQSRGRVARVVGLLVQIPLALPPLMSGIVLVYLVGPYTLLGRLFDRQLTNSTTGVILAMTFVAAPFLVVAARAAFESLDPGLLDVAETLGHGELSRFVRVAIPVAAPGIRAGMVLAWLRAFGEYGAVVVLAYNPASLPLFTYNQFSETGLAATLAPTALALGAAALVIALGRTRARRRAPHRLAAPARAPDRVPARPLRFDVAHTLGSFHLTVTCPEPVRHLAILGPSGAGKSALLRALAGLYGPASGQLFCGDEALGDLPVTRRAVGYVAQGFSLFPHLNVERQLLFAPGARPELARYWLGRLGLEGLEAALPSELSGGQRQRVALAQVLCAEPALLLLDEPFSALDVPVRQELRRLVRELQLETGLATVLVTHDPEEAAFLSEDVLVLSRGASLQLASSREVYAHPASAEVARLLGIANVLTARVGANGLECDGVSLRAPVDSFEPGAWVSWSVRPERVTLDAPGRPDVAASSHATVPGTILDVAYVGVASDYLVAIGPSTQLLVRSADARAWSVGDACALTIRAGDVSVWPTPEPAPTEVRQ